MYRKILGGFLLLFCLNMPYVASADEAVDNQTTNQTSAQVEEADADDFFNSDISNVAQLNTDDPNVSFASITKGIYTANDDVMANFVIGFIGSENLPDGTKEWLATLGFTKSVPQYFIFKYLESNMIYFYVSVALLAALFIMFFGLLDAVNPGNNSEANDPDERRSLNQKLLIKKLITVIGAPLLNKPMFQILIVSMLFVNAYANKFQTVEAVNTADRVFSTIPSEEDKFITTNNSTNWMEIAISNMKTRQAINANNQVLLGDRDSFFTNIFGQTVGEALAENNKFQELKATSVNSDSINFDATLQLNNIVNIINLTSSVDFSKSDDGYSTDERKKFGHPANVGKVELNTDTSNFENMSKESVKDGKLAKQMQRAVRYAGNNNGDILVNNSEKAYEIIYPLMLSGSLSTSTLFENSDNYSQLAALRKSINAASKKLAKESLALIEQNDIGAMSAEAKLQLSGFTSAAVMAGIQGADGSGKQATKILAYFNKLAESKINQDCTERYSLFRNNKIAVERVNAARDQDAKKFFQKDQQAGGSIVSYQCAWVRDSDATVIALGSEKPEDALKYKAEAMARKAAWDFVVLSALEGVKQNANEDKSYRNALAASKIKNMQLGLIGYPLDSMNQARIEDAINSRNNLISSSVYVRYLGPRLNENTYVNTEILYNQKDLDGESDEAKSLNEKFWPVNLKGIIAQSSVDLSAITPETESSISGKLSSVMKNMVFKMTGMSFDSLKPAFGGDPNLATREAAKACLADPVPCDQRGVQGILVVVPNLGEESYTYGFTLIIINSAFKAISVGADALKDISSDVGETIQVVLDGKGNGGKWGAQAGKWIGQLGKSVKIFADLVVAVTDALTVIAFFMIPFGIFLKFVLPMMPLFYAFVSLIKIFTNIPFYQFCFAPLFYFRMLTARTNDEFDANFKGLVQGYFSFVIAVPSLMFALIVYKGITDNFTMATLLRWILGSEVGGMIGMMVSGFVAVGSLVFILMNVLKEVTHGREALLAKFNYQENIEKEVSDMAKSITDQRIISLLRASKGAVDDATSEKKRDVKQANRDKQIDKRNARQAFHQKAGNQGLGSGSD